MAAGNFQKCLEIILKHEGGYVDHPADPGGITNLGVTKKVYEEWIGHPVSADIMRKLTPSLVAPLYKKRYWDVLKCDGLPAGLDLCAFDFGVNAGTNRAARYLQRLANVPDDGVIGPQTLKALTFEVVSKGTTALVDTYQDARRAYYKKLPTFGVFGKGWMRRVDEVEASAKQMVKK